MYVHIHVHVHCICICMTLAHVHNHIGKYVCMYIICIYTINACISWF